MRTWFDKKIQSNVRYSYIITTWLNDLGSMTKFLSVRLRTKWLMVRVQLHSLELQVLHLLQGRSSLTFRQLQSLDLI